MDRIFKHVINKVWTWFDKIIQGLQNLEILTLLLMENVESILVLIKLHFIDSLFEFIALLLDHLFTFFDFFLFILKLLNFFIDLLLHHLK